MGTYIPDRQSQVRKRSGSSAGKGEDEASYKISPEVAAANKAPPCRQFNIGQCQSQGDHVFNGFRHLHICSFCIFNKCAFYSHSESSCKTKQVKQERKNWYQNKQGQGQGYNNQGYNSQGGSNQHGNKKEGSGFGK